MATPSPPVGLPVALGQTELGVLMVGMLDSTKTLYSLHGL